MNNSFFVYSFYRFKNIKYKLKLKLHLEKYLKNKLVRGTILLADEGINGSIAGKQKILDDTIKQIRKYLKIRKINLKINKIDFLPFNKLKIRTKNEIVSLGKGKIDVKEFSASRIKPRDWNKLLERKNLKLIDTRNKYEIKIGKFNGSINPGTNSFREFPDKLKESKIKKDDEIAIYCTGGIRCEKASAYLKQEGFKKIYQLDGGIINYLDYVNKSKLKSKWKGDCFVFDNRVTVNKYLERGYYLQCYGCRHPISMKETKSIYYKKGISCPYCFKSRTEKQKKRSIARQKNIENHNIKNESHTFKKIYYHDLQ